VPNVVNSASQARRVSLFSSLLLSTISPAIDDGRPASEYKSYTDIDFGPS
jgi:hypothetical protein